MRDISTILAIECACGPTSVALWQNGHILGFLKEETANTQSACLMPMIEALLADTQLEYADLSAIACSVGPGSFTGIRVGLAAARGICFATGKPGIGVSTLEVTAYAAKDKGDTIVAVLRAGKGEWYWQHFTTQPDFKSPGDAAVAKPEQIFSCLPAGAMLVGNVQADDASIAAAAPRADILAMRAAEKTDALPLTPFYIRAPDVSMPKKKV